jgi:hypothetical protein
LGNVKLMLVTSVGALGKEDPGQLRNITITNYNVGIRGGATSQKFAGSIPDYVIAIFH